LPNQFGSSLPEPFEVDIEVPNKAASATFGRKDFVLSAANIELN
jgi:hypothetical protein